MLPFLLGLGLFVVLLQRTGIGAIVTGFRLVGSGLILLAVTCGLRYWLRTVVWYYSIEPSQRWLGLFQLFKIRLAGETFGELMFAGLLMGESAKALAASRWLPGISAFSSLFIENLLFGLSVVVFLASGVVILLSSALFPARVLALALTLTVPLALSALFLFLLLHYRWRLLGPLLDFLENKPTIWGGLKPIASQVRNFEDTVHAFYRDHQSLFFLLLGLEFTTHLVGVIEAYWTLHWIQGHGTWLASFLVESANRLINSFFSIIPLRIGVDEGAMAVVLQAIGYPGSIGISLALVRKARLLVWMVPGMFLIRKYSLLASDRPLRS